MSLALPIDAVHRLDELSAESGLARARVAALLLEELLPTVQSVRMRLQVSRKREVTP